MPTEDLISTAPLSDMLRALAQRGELRRYRKGTLLIQEGDRGDTLFVILAGRLRAFCANQDGKEVTFGVYGPGEYLGEMSLDGGPRSASVITVDDCVCAVVDRLRIERFLAEQPAFAFELLAKVIRRARAATLTARQMALNDVYGRLVELLRQLSMPLGAEGLQVIDPLPTHQEIANRLGCSREMVSRLIKDLSRGGFVEAQRHRLVVRRRLPDRW